MNAYFDIVSSLKTQMKAGSLIGIDNRGTHWYCNLIYNTNEINLQQKLVFWSTKMYFWTFPKG
jgi:hypothetical protein